MQWIWRWLANVKYIEYFGDSIKSHSTCRYIITTYLHNYLWPRINGDLSPPNRTATLWFLCKPYGDLTVFSTPQGHRKPCIFFINLILNFFQKPQCHNAATTPQGHRTVAARSPCDGREVAYVFTLSWVPRKSYGGLTASWRRPHDTLTAAVRQTCNSRKSREVAVRSPPGLLAITLRFFLFHESYDRRAVGVTFVTTITVGHKTLWFLQTVLQTVNRKRFTNRRPQNRTVTVRRLHDMWPRHKQGLS